MPNYKIIGCSTCDFDQQRMDDLNIAIEPMSFSINGCDYKNYLDNRELPLDEFFKMLDNGAISKTTQLNLIEVKDYVRFYLKQDLDILFLSFSSGLSGTYNSARLAFEELKEEFPNRKLILIDTLCASSGEGLLDYIAGLNQKNGMSLEENAKAIEDMKLKVRHWFTVDELETLRRGGRISTTKALAAKMFNIKPILVVNNEGKLIATEKKVGHKNALKYLVSRRLEDFDNNYPIVVSNATNPEDLEYLLKCINEELNEKNIKAEIIKEKVGPVIGGHTGSSFCAVFTIGKHR